MRIVNYDVKDNLIKINYSSKSYYVELINEDIIHFYDLVSEYDNHITAMSSVSFDITFNDKLTIKTAKYTIAIGDDFFVSIADMNGNLLLNQVKPTYLEEAQANYELLAKEGHKAEINNNAKPISIAVSLNDNDYIYALGERAGFLNRRGYQYDNWNTDDPSSHNENYRTLYKSIPFAIIFNECYQYGIFLDNHYHSYFDCGKTVHNELKISSDGGNYNYFFVGGDTLKNVVGNYTIITGKAEIPQYFTLGHHQSRWSYASKDEVLALAKSFRKYDIPCNVIHLDIDYMDNYKVFTINDERFSDFKAFVDEMHNMDFKIVCIIDPGTKVEKGYDTYENLVKNKMVATLDNKVYINEVWPGESVYPTFNKPETREFWANEIKKLTDLGVDGIWDDMNEPASFKGPLPLDVDFGGFKHEEIHNLYGHFMAMATYDGLRKHTNKRPFVITRACFSGTQKYSTIWTGDNQSLWHHLRLNIPQLTSLGLSGFSFVGSDLGGFGGDATKELLCRYVEAAVLYPLFRNHSAMGTRRQEPWTFDEETINIYRKFTKLRYELIPYMYDLFYKSSKDGLPVIRPLVLEYPHDKNTYSLNDEFMLGDSIISAPVINQGEEKRLVYLPEGVWYDYFTNKEYEGGYHIVDAKLDELPLFVKKNTILPIGTIMDSTKKPNTITFKVYGDGEYIHYQDDLESYNYTNGEYNLYRITAKDNKANVELIYNGYKKYDKITVIVNDKSFEF